MDRIFFLFFPFFFFWLVSPIPSNSSLPFFFFSTTLHPTKVMVVYMIVQGRILLSSFFFSLLQTQLGRYTQEILQIYIPFPNAVDYADVKREIYKIQARVRLSSSLWPQEVVSFECNHALVT